MWKNYLLVKKHRKVNFVIFHSRFMSSNFSPPHCQKWHNISLEIYALSNVWLLHYFNVGNNNLESKNSFIVHDFSKKRLNLILLVKLWHLYSKLLTLNWIPLIVTLTFYLLLLWARSQLQTKYCGMLRFKEKQEKIKWK